MDELKVTSKINRRPTRNHLVSDKKNVPKNGSFKEILNRVDSKLNSSIVGEGSIKKNSEIRYDLVDKFKLDMKKGTYEIKASEIADKIVQKVRDQKNKHTL